MLSDTAAPPSLFDLIARSWKTPGPVRHAVFNNDASAVAFAGDGIVSIASLTDPEPPDARVRVAADDGRHTIRPREKPVRPMAEVKNLTGPLVGFGTKTFLGASRDGTLVSITPRGQTVPVPLDTASPVTALARDPVTGTVAVGTGGRVALKTRDAPDRWIEIGEDVTCVAFGPDGGQLAVGHAGGVSIARDGALVGGVALDSDPHTLSFRADGGLLACGLDHPGFALVDPVNLAGELVLDYPTQVRSFAWSGPANALATSGAFRTIAWALDGDSLGDTLEAGRNGLVIVERVAASPDRPLLAVGYANGLVCLAQIGGGDEMMLRPDGGAVTTLTWADDGIHLALGDQVGNAALIAFPKNFFKG